MFYQNVDIKVKTFITNYKKSLIIPTMKILHKINKFMALKLKVK